MCKRLKFPPVVLILGWILLVYVQDLCRFSFLFATEPVVSNFFTISWIVNLEVGTSAGNVWIYSVWTRPGDYHLKYKYPQLVSNTMSGRGMNAMKPLHYRSVSSKGADRPRLTHHHNRPTTPDAPSQGRVKWNEMDEMSVEKWWNEICGRGKREKPREKPTTKPTWRNRDAKSGPQRWETI